MAVGDRQLEQRYEDAPEAELILPTRPAFVAGKTATWCDRRAPRDLWDLWALNRIGAFEPGVADLYRKFGPTNKLPGEWQFSDAPIEADWESQLSGQTRLTVAAREAAIIVARAWRALGEL